mmetsp:Transcript_11182/g.16664  ORF Transcript_11182/g.16664 Transcript_11182/m.16664 type:complete len:472 (+) Transcript_11182:86-1501(+)
MISRKAKIFAVRAALVASLGGLLMGFDLGVVTGALPQLKTEMSLSSNELGLVVSVMILGALLGSLIGGFICDLIGRWGTIMLTSVLFSLGGTLLSLAETVGMLYVGRFLVGMGIAFSCVADVSYLSEVAHKHYRGSMVSAYELMVAVGILFAFLIGYMFRDVEEGWRYMFAIGILLAILQAVLMFSMPESPKWLAFKEKTSEARKVLSLSSGADDAMVEEMLNEMKIEILEAGKVDTLSLFTHWRPQFFISIFLVLIQQSTGNGVVLAFAPEIIESIEKSSFVLTSIDSQYKTAVMLGLLKAFSTGIVIYKIDSIGRRKLVLFGSFFSALSLLILCLAYVPVTDKFSFAEVLIGCSGLVTAYSVSFGPVTWVVTAELFPPPLRGRALGLSQLMNWISSFVISAVFLDMMNIWGGFITFGCYFVSTCMGFAFLYKFLPETRGKNPEEISEAIKKNSKSGEYVAISTTGSSSC